MDVIQNPYLGKVYAGVELGQEIGRGGMGVVMKGTRKSDGAVMAVKLLPKAEAKDAKYISRFEREARLLMQLRHPNILHVDNMGHAEDGTYFIVMEFIDGSSLTDLIKNLGRVPPAQALGITKSAAMGLKSAHEQNVIHRDIKPDNVLLTKEGRVKLADFGLAKDTSENVRITVTGQVLGTPAFMSPEQGKGAKTDHRTDIYSLGVTLYYMLAGRRPFEGSSPIEIVLKHIKEPPPPIQEAAPGLPESVYGLVDRMLAKDPEGRPQTADEVIEAIDAVAEQEGYALEEAAAKDGADSFDMTLDIGGLGDMVKEAAARDQTQATGDAGQTYAAQYVETGEIIGDVQDEMVGKTIGGKYKVRSKLGEGGMGSVYLVRHVHLQQDYALKVLIPELAANSAFRERFMREAKAATAFTHKHAIQMRDFGQEGDMLYMTMDFSRGETLKRVLESDGAISERKTALIAHQTLNALREAHAAGLVHRDLKPDNIMIESRHGGDFVRILDFGIAKILDPEAPKDGRDKGPGLTRTGTVVGTLQYMSPEQAAGSSQIDARSDLYSLASILYECVAGARHIEAENPQQMLYKLVTEKPVPISKKVKGISRKFEQLVMKNLSKDPGGRCQSAEEFLAELESCSENLHSSIAIRRTGPGILTAALVSLGVVAAAAVVFFLINPFARSQEPGPGPSPIPSPGPDPGRQSAERDAAYAGFKAEGDKAFAGSQWESAASSYRKAREVKQTGEIEDCIKKAQWHIHMAAFESLMKRKDYDKALNEVVYGLKASHTTIEQNAKAVELENEVRALVEKAEGLIAAADAHDGRGELLHSLPLFRQYVAGYPLGKHWKRAKDRAAAIEKGLESFVGLMADSDPQGAEVFLDGVSIGRTPCLHPSISPGSHEILMDLKGYNPVKKEVAYEAGARLAVEEKLQKERFGSVRILSKSQPVLVKWQDRPIGQTPVTIERVAEGEQVIEIAAGQNASYLMKVDVRDGATSRIEVDLEALAADELKAYENLPRGSSLPETVEIYSKFLEAFPRGPHSAGARDVITGLEAENRDFEAIETGGDKAAAVSRCREYLSRHGKRSYPYGWFRNETEARLAVLIAEADKEAFEEIGRKTTFRDRRSAAEKYMERFPSGAHAADARRFLSALADEERLYGNFLTADAFGKRVASGKRYLMDFPSGLMVVDVRKALEAMIAEEKGFYEPLLSIKDVEVLASKCKAYLFNFRGSDNQPDVEARLKGAEHEQAAFDLTANGPEECESYIRNYPDGWYRKEVDARLKSFGWSEEKAGKFGLKGKMPKGVVRSGKAGEYLSERDGSVMVFVPAGYFPMGTNDYYAADEDKPEVVVYLTGYFIDKYEVSNKQYGKFLEWLKSEADPHKFCRKDEPKGKDHTPGFAKDSAFNGPDQPVVGVDWFDAMAYAAWAGKSLPTEAQWEKAASANFMKKIKTRHPWGDEDPAQELCNFGGKAGKTIAVAGLPRSASVFGAEQMCGNAAEWCLDSYFDGFLEAVAQRFPPGSSGHVKNPFNDSKRLKLRSVRGGSFADGAEEMAVTRRAGFEGRSNGLGFRCVIWRVEEGELPGKGAGGK